MTNYQTTSVFKYISYLETYLKGDLEQFHKVCNEVEIQEQNDLRIGLQSYITSSSTPEPPTTLPPTTVPPQNESTYFTTETTRNPNDFTFRPIYFRSTIPHTLTLFSTIDILGFLSGSKDDHTKTNQNFKEFFKHSSISVTTNEIKVLNIIFRQGMVHVYFPKLDLGISYHSTNPVDKLFFKNSDNLVVLNVNRLEEIVIKCLDTIKDKSELYIEMERRYLSMVSTYQSNSGLIQRLTF